MIAKRLTLLAVCGMLAIAGCGGDDDSSSEPAGGGGSTTPAAPSGSVVEVKIKNIMFDPHDVTVKVGQTIKWTNEDSVEHNVTAQSGAEVQSDNIGEGGTFEYKAEKAGKIEYVCTIHPGQDGTITVTE